MRTAVYQRTCEELILAFIITIELSIAYQPQYFIMQIPASVSATNHTNQNCYRETTSGGMPVNAMPVEDKEVHVGQYYTESFEAIVSMHRNKKKKLLELYVKT